jgi:hypothetical protein
MVTAYASYVVIVTVPMSQVLIFSLPQTQRKKEEGWTWGKQPHPAKKKEILGTFNRSLK